MCDKGSPWRLDFADTTPMEQIAETSFEEAANLATSYAPASALFLQLGLARPQVPKAAANDERVLIWGVSSNFGAIAAQLASHAGYTVIGVAHGRHEAMVRSLGVVNFVDRASGNVVSDLVALGPFKAVLAAADDAADQAKIGQILAGQGGGEFLSTMGVRRGVELPDGVTGRFHQFIDDYLDPANSDFTQWFWWDYLEKVLASGELKSTPLEIYGGLSRVGSAWNALRSNEISGKRIIIKPEEEM